MNDYIEVWWPKLPIELQKEIIRAYLPDHASLYEGRLEGTASGRSISETIQIRKIRAVEFAKK